MPNLEEQMQQLELCSEVDGSSSRFPKHRKLFIEGKTQEAVQHLLCHQRRKAPADSSARKLREQEVKEKPGDKRCSGRLLLICLGREGWQQGKTPKSHKLPLPPCERHSEMAQKGQSVRGTKSRRIVKAFQVEKQEDGKRRAGRVTLPRLPQQQAGRQSNRLQRSPLQEHQQRGLAGKGRTGAPCPKHTGRSPHLARSYQLPRKKADSPFQKRISNTAPCPPSAGGTYRGVKPHPPSQSKRKLPHRGVKPRPPSWPKRKLQNRGEKPRPPSQPKRKLQNRGEEPRPPSQPKRKLQNRGEKPRPPSQPKRKLQNRGEKPRPPSQPKRKLPHLEDNTKPEEQVSGSVRKQEAGQQGGLWDNLVEEHLWPTTIGGELGPLMDRFRKDTFQCYLKSLERCRERGVCISDRALQRGLLLPGDRIIQQGDNIWKLRQAGGYYDMASFYDSSSSGHYSKSGRVSGRLDKEMSDKFLQLSNMKQRNDNMFWPGHLLDKMRLYFPDEEFNRAHALFSYVQPGKAHFYGF